MQLGTQNFTVSSWTQDATVGGYRTMITLNIPATDDNRIAIIPLGVANQNNAGQIGYAAWQSDNIIRVVMATNTIPYIKVRYAVIRKI